ncbi:PE-PPE domain-containing protein [Rhodococcus qingshengii]|uniref:PE-PPE domain-containing protein n=1 Tax=Rhodococcus qingshengii TaxID=334542 RepID=UPI0037C684E3
MRGLVVAALVAVMLSFGGVAQARNVIVVDGTTNSGAVLLAPDIQPGDTVTYVRYPATVLWPSYNRSVEAGKQALREALIDVPEDTVVVGYSQGARIAGDVLAEPETVGVNGVLYSDPRQYGAGVETQLPFNLPGATMTGERDPFVVPVETHCIPSDGVCDWNNRDPLRSIIGYARWHTTYFN